MTANDPKRIATLRLKLLAAIAGAGNPTGMEQVEALAGLMAALIAGAPKHIDVESVYAEYLTAALNDVRAPHL